MDTFPKPIKDHSFLAEELLIPNTNKTDGSRLNMVCSHLSQLLILKEAEKPLVFTNFENQVGKHSSGIKRLEANAKVLAVLEFNKYDKLVLLQKGKTLDIFHKRYAKHITENFGYQLHYNDSLEDVGKSMKKQEILHRNSMYDEIGNFQYGVNLNTVYLPFKGHTYEDPVVISESAAKKLTHTNVDVYHIMLNQNDVLIKDLPSVGEYVKDGVLTVRRRINNSTVLSEFKGSTFDKRLPDDVVFYAKGMVSDIKVYCNTFRDLNYPYNSKLKEIEDTQSEVYKDLLNILERKSIAKLTFSDDVNHWRRKATDYLARLPFSYEKSQYDGIVIEVTVVDEEKCFKGSKLTGRYGNKGVVSLILPDDQMPVTEDGRRAEAVVNSLGVLGRMNISQNYEHELNYIASEILRTSKSVKQFTSRIMKFYNLVSPQLYTYLNEMTSEELLPYIQEMYDTGNIYIHQPPFYDNITLDKMAKVYDTFKIQKTKMKDIQTPLIFGKLYFVKLRHEALKKYSVRSVGTTNLLDVPHKTNEAQKRGNAPYNNNPTRMGEQEYINMVLLRNPEVQQQFIRHYASDTIQRQAMLEAMIMTNPEDLNEIPSNDDVVTNSAQTVRSIFRALGVELKHEDIEE